MNKYIEQIILGIIFGVIGLALLKLAGFSLVKTAHGAEYRLLEPSEIVLEAEKYDNLRDPHIPEYTDSWTYGTALGVKFDLVNVKAKQYELRLFYDPVLKFRATESQVRQGGLYYEGGVSVDGKERGLKLFRRHESLHCLECNEQTGSQKTYQLLDSWVAQLKWRLK